MEARVQSELLQNDLANRYPGTSNQHYLRSIRECELLGTNESASDLSIQFSVGNLTTTAIQATFDASFQFVRYPPG